MTSTSDEKKEEKPKKYKPKKKYVKKIIRESIPCSHCGQIFHFPVLYCPICKTHSHQAIAGTNPNGCSGCLRGLTTSGQAHMRANRTWNGVHGIEGEYDRPEFYDMELEINNMTIMPVWINNECDNVY